MYAIRSWLYISLHAFPTRLSTLLTSAPKSVEFYLLRILLVAACAAAETRLYSAVSTNVSRKIGLLFALASMTSAGMFHAATAYLPSSFAMYTAMLGAAAFLDRSRDGGARVVEGVTWFAVGGILGWPFSLAMAVPWVVEEVFVSVNRSGLGTTVGRFVVAGLAALAVLVGGPNVFFEIGEDVLTRRPGDGDGIRLMGVREARDCAVEYRPLQRLWRGREGAEYLRD